MERYETNLAVGDSLQIGDCLMTVVDIDGDEVSFRIDHLELESLEAGSHHRSSLPRK